MGTTQCAARTVAAKETSQFELTKKVLNNLKHFKLSPTTINVLWYLTSCYNPKHGYVFPKQSTIAENLRCSERSVVRAIQSLVKEGLIIVECKYINRYRFTSKLIGECAQNLSDDKGQFDIKGDKLTSHEMKQKKETKKEPVVKKSLTVDSNSIEFEEFKILKDYAIKHGAKNVNAYVNVLKQNGSATKILQDYKAKENAKKRALRSIEETQGLIIGFQNMKYEYENPNNVSVWVELGKKINASQKQAF